MAKKKIGGPRSDDREEWRANGVAGRERREAVADRVAEQVRSLIVSGDVGGGRSVIADRIRAIAAAERGGGKEVLRSEVMALAAAAGAWAADLDAQVPRDGRIAPGVGR